MHFSARNIFTEWGSFLCVEGFIHTKLKTAEFLKQGWPLTRMVLSEVFNCIAMPNAKIALWYNRTGRLGIKHITTITTTTQRKNTTSAAVCCCCFLLTYTGRGNGRWAGEGMGGGWGETVMTSAEEDNVGLGLTSPGCLVLSGLDKSKTTPEYQMSLNFLASTLEPTAISGLKEQTHILLDQWSRQTFLNRGDIRKLA